MYEVAIPTFQGLEEVLAAEVRSLAGATDVRPGRRVVTCRGDRDFVYRANLHLRTGLRVLLNVGAFRVRHEQDLYDRLRAFDWTPYLRPEGSLFVNVVSQFRQFRNTHFIALLTKDAIVDQFRDKFAGTRPSVSKERPDLRIHLRVGRGGEVDLSLDSSGEGLHRRGYRKRTGAAPLNEVLSAGLLRLAEYSGEEAFVDPMCGSGTIAAEAAMIATHRAPGLFRDFGFQRWPDFEQLRWSELRTEALREVRPAPHPIVAADIDGVAVALTRATLDRAKVQAYVEVREEDFRQLMPTAPQGLLVTNPPYEMRLQTGDIEGFYREIGDTFKSNWAGYTAWLISANSQAVKSVGLRTSRKVEVMNGPVEARFCKYELYRGSR